MFRWLFAIVVACMFSFSPPTCSAHEARFGHGYGIANGDRMFYGPCSGVPFMRRGPVRRTVAVIATGQGPIARACRSRRCSH